jgi:hypothetical protein
VAESVLKLEAVKKAYNVGTSVETEVLHGINLTIKPGEFLALMVLRVPTTAHCSISSDCSIAQPQDAFG